MKYELKNYRVDGPPTINAEDGSIKQPLIVTTGIEGDTYGFEKVDDCTATSSMSKTGTEIEADYKAEALALVARKYPNT